MILHRFFLCCEVFKKRKFRLVDIYSSVLNFGYLEHLRPQPISPAENRNKSIGQNFNLFLFFYIKVQTYTYVHPKMSCLDQLRFTSLLNQGHKYSFLSYNQFMEIRTSTLVFIEILRLNTICSIQLSLIKPIKMYLYKK